MKTLVAVVTVLLFFLCQAVYAESDFRCGNRVVSVGAMTYTVLQNCGVPDYREIKVLETITGRRGKKHTGTKVVRIPAGSTFEGASSGDETWYYDPGPAGFVTVLEFSKSRLTNIKNVGYGSTQGIQSWEERKKLVR